MPWNLDNDRPIYLQLMERIQHDIISGVYKPGDKLPSVRDLAVEAAVNPNTMQKRFLNWSAAVSYIPNGRAEGLLQTIRICLKRCEQNWPVSTYRTFSNRCASWAFLMRIRWK